MSDKKRFKVRLLFKIEEVVEVAADTEDEAEKRALEEITGLPVNAEHSETRFTQLW